MSRPVPYLKVNSLADIHAANTALYAMRCNVPGWASAEGINDRMKAIYSHPVPEHLRGIYVRDRSIGYDWAGNEVTRLDFTVVNSLSHLLRYLRAVPSS